MGSDPSRIIIDAAKNLRVEAVAKTKEAHNWLSRKWIEIKAVFGFV